MASSHAGPRWPLAVKPGRKMPLKRNRFRAPGVKRNKFRVPALEAGEAEENPRSSAESGPSARARIPAEASGIGPKYAVNARNGRKSGRNSDLKCCGISG